MTGNQPGRRVKSLGYVLLVLGVVLALTGGVVAIVQASGPVRADAVSPVTASPFVTTVALTSRTYYAFQEDDPSGRPAGSSHALVSDELIVTDPSGLRVFVGDDSSGDTIEHDGKIYTSVANFDADRYQVAATDETGARIFIASEFGDSPADVAGWLSGAGGGVLVFLIGLIVVLVGAVRQRRHAPPVALPLYGMSPPPAPAGWYPQNGRYRFWDGYRWLP